MTYAKLAAAFCGCSLAELGICAVIAHRFSFAWFVASTALLCLSVNLHRSRS